MPIFDDTAVTPLVWERTVSGTYLARVPANPAGITAYHIDPPVPGERRQWRVYSRINNTESRYHGNPDTLAQAQEFCARNLVFMTNVFQED